MKQKFPIGNKYKNTIFFHIKSGPGQNLEVLAGFLFSSDLLWTQHNDLFEG